MVKDVEEAAESRVAAMLQPLACIFREVNGQRPIRPEQPEQPHLQAWRLTVARLERRQRRRRKRKVRFLPKAHGFVDRTERLAPARVLVVQALEAAQRLVKIVAI